MLRSGAKESPTTKNSDVLNRNFDLSVIDHIGQLENPHYSYTCSSCTLMCSNCYITVIQIWACLAAVVSTSLFHAIMPYWTLLGTYGLLIIYTQLSMCINFSFTQHGCC